MRPILAVVAVFVAACAPGSSLAPGQSTEADVLATMGQPAEKHQVGAETVYYYPEIPWGYRTYAARIGADGRLLAIEQRLTEENTAKIVKGQTKQAEVRD